ncbi:MAG TPA: DOPA 4,5-dioxygenase family protein [Stellaceae bacterium]|nr:DOPA 4,5-dioxygenase family protein [Stellaceae bacterium]
MIEGWADPARITGYHAHIYYTPETRPLAERLRAAIGERFMARIGAWHDGPVGPHTAAMYQVAFTVEELPRLLPWLMLNRGALDVLVHPTTEDSLADHTRFAAWLGTKLPLKLEVLRGGPRPG